LSDLEASLRRYRLLAIVGNSYFWVPVSLLYPLSRFGVGTALLLMAVYYGGVVVAEVPTGWGSDRFGRKLVLVLGAGCWIVAPISFLVAGSRVELFVVGNLLLAIGFAFRSGTDVAFHYDTLEALGRDDEYEARESAISRTALVATAACALVGGGLGAIDLRLPYVAALVAAAIHLILASGLVEPPLRSLAMDHPRPLGAVLRRVREPLLGWLLLYVVAEVVMEHLVSELGQPYIAATLGEAERGDLGRAALVSGMVVAVVSAVAAVGAQATPLLRRRLGTVATLLLLAVLQVGVLGAMAITTSALVLPLLCLRSLQPASARILVSATAAPRLGVDQRATFLSLCSLSGRLAHALVLVVLASLDDRTQATRLGLVIALALLAVIALTARRPAVRAEVATLRR